MTSEEALPTAFTLKEGSQRMPGLRRGDLRKNMAEEEMFKEEMPGCPFRMTLWGPSMLLCSQTHLSATPRPRKFDAGPGDTSFGV